MAPPKKIRGPCSVEGCSDISKYGEMCGKHYKRFWRHGENVSHLHEQPPECSVDGCAKKPKAFNFCDIHYRRWLRHLDPTAGRAEVGEGGLNASGYRMLTKKGKRQYEHIAIAEKALGKPLPPGAVVHHVTNNPSDNYGPFKLVICPDQAYHLHIHELMRKKGISFRTGWPNEPGPYDNLTLADLKSK